MKSPVNSANSFDKATLASDIRKKSWQIFGKGSLMQKTISKRSPKIKTLPNMSKVSKSPKEP